MPPITLNEETKLAELIEALKPFAAEQDGELVLDTSALKTRTDVDNVLSAKGKVKEELREAKAKLAAFTEIFGDDPEEAREEAEALRNRGGTNSEEVLELKKQLRALSKERDKFRADYEGQAARIAELDRRELSDRKNAKFENAILKGLDPKYDRNKARTVWGDLCERVKFREDDPEEFADFEQGKSVADAIRERLDLYGAYVPAQGGRSNPGSAGPQNGGEPKGLFEEAAAQIKF